MRVNCGTGQHRRFSLPAHACMNNEITFSTRLRCLPRLRSYATLLQTSVGDLIVRMAVNMTYSPAISSQSVCLVFGYGLSKLTLLLYLPNGR